MPSDVVQSKTLLVRLADINLNPGGPFCMSYQFPLQRLKASIERVGILNQPYLFDGSPFIVVCGYRRLLAVRELGWTEVACRVLPHGLHPLEALLFSLYDNQTVRQFNPIEKAMVLKRLCQYLPKEEVLNYLSLLELPSNRNTLQEYVNLADLDDEIKASVAAERLSTRVCGRMRSLGAEDQLQINHLFTALKWSFTLQWQSMLWIQEIADREGRSVRDVVDDERISTVLTKGTMNGPQKVKAIVRAIRQWRFPKLVASEKSFRQGIRDLRLPPKVRVVPPPYFEGTEYKLEVGFREGKELRKTVAELYRTPGLEEIPRLWKSEQFDDEG
ncbi:MAG: ParB/RepB/Spo0J family partition protein [Thermodesulfobacteriota bacterium]